MSLIIRRIQPHDNAVLATIIRDSLAEFGAARPGTVYFDPTTDDLFQLFLEPHSAYFVAVEDESVIGGAGIFPSAGLPPDTVELAKMYLAPAARGKGIGRMLMDTCLMYAGEQGYSGVYLETLPELFQAVKVYERFGFESLPGPLGNTGHFGCSMWMIKHI